MNLFLVRVLLIFPLAWVCSCQPQNDFKFCRDFDATGCVEPQRGKITYPTEKAVKNKTILDFANSVYFRGDRLAFELRSAYARRAVTFECLKGHYFFAGETASQHELEYLELRDNSVYGLVMLGSLLEKKFAAMKAERYQKLPDFTVTYSITCGKDLLAAARIAVELQ